MIKESINKLFSILNCACSKNMDLLMAKLPPLTTLPNLILIKFIFDYIIYFIVGYGCYILWILLLIFS